MLASAPRVAFLIRGRQNVGERRINRQIDAQERLGY